MNLYAYAPLALREGNACGQEELNAFCRDEENARYLELNEDGREEAASHRLSGSTGMDDHGNDHSLDLLVRETTSMPEEGANESNPNIERGVSMKLWFDLGKSTLADEELLARDGLLQHLMGARSGRNLEQTQDFEKKPTYTWLFLFGKYILSCFYLLGLE